MPVSKLKNLAILILLLANAALLSLLIPRQLEARKQAQNLHRRLTELCAQQNVSLDLQAVPDTVNLYALELADKEAGQSQALTALLGQAPVQADHKLTMEDNVRIGTWENGTLSLKLSNQKEVSDLRAAAKKTLKKMDFEISSLGQPQRLSPGIYAVNAKQAVLGVPIFSDGVTLTYSNNCLSQLSGQFYAGTLTQAGDSACISAAQAVVNFLGERVKLGWVGSSITGMEQGYLRTDQSSAAVRLTPVWKLMTDTGSFYVNGLTGSVTASE